MTDFYTQKIAIVKTLGTEDSIKPRIHFLKGGVAALSKNKNLILVDSHSLLWIDPAPIRFD